MGLLRAPAVSGAASYPCCFKEQRDLTPARVLMVRLVGGCGHLVGFLSTFIILFPLLLLGGSREGPWAKGPWPLFGMVGADIFTVVLFLVWHGALLPKKEPVGWNFVHFPKEAL